MNASESSSEGKVSLGPILQREEPAGSRPKTPFPRL